MRVNLYLQPARWSPLGQADEGAVALSRSHDDRAVRFADMSENADAATQILPDRPEKPPLWHTVWDRSELAMENTMMDGVWLYMFCNGQQLLNLYALYAELHYFGIDRYTCISAWANGRQRGIKIFERNASLPDYDRFEATTTTEVRLIIAVPAWVSRVTFVSIDFAIGSRQ